MRFLDDSSGVGPQIAFAGRRSISLHFSTRDREFPSRTQRSSDAHRSTVIATSSAPWNAENANGPAIADPMTYGRELVIRAL
jgi:hypothetical protein